MKAWKKLLLGLSFAVLSSGVLTACGPETSLSVKYMVGDKEYVVQKYDLNDTIALPKDPTEDGKRFIGWYTDPECTVPYAEGSVTQGLTLYAKFEASVVFIIVNTNGGEKINMISVKPGEPYSVPDAVKPGHTFTGYYYVDANGETQEFPSEGVLPEAKDIVIFASYTVNKYTVTLHNGYGDDEVVEVEYNKTYAPKAVVRPGYTFVAWHTVESGQSEETIYNSATPITANVELYAQYTANNYTITISNNVDSKKEEVEVTYNTAYTLTAPKKDGYSFINFTYNGIEIPAQGIFLSTQSLPVVANYSKNAYSVIFKDAATGNVITTKNVEYGNIVSEPTKELAKVGYTYTLSANVTEAITANTEITVTYTANPYKLTITNNVNTDKKVLDVVYDGNYALTADEITGYTFKNFTVDGAVFDASGKYAYTQNLSIVANYTKNSYTVTFVDTDGNVLDEQTVIHGEKAVLPSLNKTGYTYTLSANATEAVTANTKITVTYTAKPVTITVLNAGDTYTTVETTFGATFTLQEPTKTGYTFQGFKGSDGKTYETGVEYTCNFESLTLTAQWDGNDMTVYFVVDSEYKTVTVLKDHTVAKPAQDPTKDGYTFKGWSSNKDNYEVYDFSKPVTEDLALYAYFTPNSYYIFIDLDEGVGETKVSVTYGAAYTLTNPTKKGHIFDGYVYEDGNAYTKTEVYNVVGDTNLKAKWKEDYKTVIFHIDDQETTQQVLNGFTVSRPENPTKEGYTFNGWYATQTYTAEFDFNQAITEPTNVYAKFDANSYLIMINLNGGEGTNLLSVIFNQPYDLNELAKPTKKGYIFNGYVLEENDNSYPVSGTYTVAGNTNLKATWKEDYKTVTFRVDNKESTQKVLNGFTVNRPENPTKEGYTFNGWFDANDKLYNFDGEITADITLYAKFTVNAYALTIDNNGGEGTTSFDIEYGESYTLQTPTKLGYKFKGYFTEDGQEFPLTGSYQYTKAITIKAEWESDLINNEDGSFIDHQNGITTYVYLTDYNFTFRNTGLEVKSFISGDSNCIKIVPLVGGFDTTLTTIKPCEFVVIVTKYDSNGVVIDTYERTLKVVENVATFTTGESYKGAWVNRNSENWNNNEKNGAMVVGINDYRPDIKVEKLSTEDNKLHPLSLADANVQVEVFADGVATTAYTLNGDSFNFNESLIGKTITINLQPRYAIYKGQTVTFNFVLNDAVNVYTSQEMRTYFEDTNIREINVLRNIKVELAEGQLYHGSNPADYDHSNDDLYKDKGYGTNVPPADLVAPINTREGSAAFDRLSGNIKVNGNYFTVDGSNIPLVDNRFGHYKIGDYNEDLIVQNVQFSIFKFGKDETPINDKMIMENLYVLGNMTLATNWGANDGETYTVTVNGKAKKVLTMSGAALGIQVRCANADLDNVTIRRCTTGISTTSFDPRSDINPVTNTGHPIALYLKDCLLESHWANNVYMYGFAHATFDSCYVGVASGAAIHVDAIPSPIAVNPEVYFTNGTKVENWVAGSETWFTVYQMNLLVPQLKKGTEEQVSGASGNALTILKNDGSQLFNFAFLMKGTPTATDWADGLDDKGKATVTVQGLNALQELQAQAPDVGKQYANDNMHRVMNGEISPEQLEAEANQYAMMWVLTTAQTVRVAPGEDPKYAQMISMFGEIVAYLGVTLRG